MQLGSGITVAVAKELPYATGVAITKINKKEGLRDVVEFWILIWRDYPGISR